MLTVPAHVVHVRYSGLAQTMAFRLMRALVWGGIISYAASAGVFGFQPYISSYVDASVAHWQNTLRTRSINLC